MDIKLNPIFRETYTLRDAGVKEKGYYITDACAGCGACAAICPQRCIEGGRAVPDSSESLSPLRELL